MTKRTTKLNEKGFTLLELLIVVVVVGIVSTLALLQMEGSKQNLTMQNVAIELKVYLERARFDSVKRSASASDEMARVVINGPAAFSMRADINQNGELGVSETREIDFSYQNGIKFFADNLVFPVVITFNNRGQALATDGDGNIITPNFLVCQEECTNISTASDSFQIVSVSPTGTVSILNGDELLAVPTSPTNINTATNGNIKTLVSTVPNDGSITDIIY